MSIGELRNCAREDCGLPYHKGTHNQKYCTNECCRIETNRKIMEKYHERVAIRRGKKRSCRSCSTPLSRYNNNDRCGACSAKVKKENLGEAKRLVNSIMWL